jgi:formate hydrogenlyase subunit 6/NADH:ubiquinone oxidoreductase subunit I
VSLTTILRDVFGGLTHRPVTVQYPAERQPVPAHLRGALTWNPEKCTGCGLCVKDCPSNAIELITLDKAAKQFVIRYHADRCAFCAQCVQNCRFECLGMSPEQWELAALTKAPFTVMLGNEADVDKFLARGA